MLKTKRQIFARVNNTTYGLVKQCWKISLPLSLYPWSSMQVFFGCKISGSCIILGSQYEVLSDPHHEYCKCPPPLGKYLTVLIGRRHLLQVLLVFVSKLFFKVFFVLFILDELLVRYSEVLIVIICTKRAIKNHGN